MIVFKVPRKQRTSGGTDLDVQSGDAKLLAAGSDVLGSQHGSVGRRLVTIGLDLHSTGNTADSFPATASNRLVSICFSNYCIAGPRIAS